MNMIVMNIPTIVPCSQICKWCFLKQAIADTSSKFDKYVNVLRRDDIRSEIEQKIWNAIEENVEDVDKIDTAAISLPYIYNDDYRSDVAAGISTYIIEHIINEHKLASVNKIKILFTMMTDINIIRGATAIATAVASARPLVNNIYSSIDLVMTINHIPPVDDEIIQYIENINEIIFVTNKYTNNMCNLIVMLPALNRIGNEFMARDVARIADIIQNKMRNNLNSISVIPETISTRKNLIKLNDISNVRRIFQSRGITVYQSPCQNCSNRNKCIAMAKDSVGYELFNVYSKVDGKYEPNIHVVEYKYGDLCSYLKVENVISREIPELKTSGGSNASIKSS